MYRSENIIKVPNSNTKEPATLNLITMPYIVIVRKVIQKRRQKITPTIPASNANAPPATASRAIAKKILAIVAA